MIKQVRLTQFTLLGVAILAFEIFNYATTEIAVTSILGDIRVLGISLGTLFALAACLADVGGISRAMNQETSLSKEPTEVWLAVGAWLVAAFLNALMTWYSVLELMVVRDIGNELITRNELLVYVPVSVALFVFIIRFTLINSLVYGLDHMRTAPKQRKSLPGPSRQQSYSGLSRPHFTPPTKGSQP